MGQTNPLGKEIIKIETELCGQPLSLEVGRVGFRTSASVLARYGDTVVLGTAMVSSNKISGMDYFPLSIDYEEKMYAAGKVSGSRFIKREGRPSDDAILISRLIDRPIRPLWPKGYRQEVQGVATVLSMDPDFRPDMIAMIAMSAAFMLTGAPFDGPVAGLRVGLVDGKLKAFATATDICRAPASINGMPNFPTTGISSISCSDCCYFFSHASFNTSISRFNASFSASNRALSSIAAFRCICMAFITSFPSITIPAQCWKRGHSQRYPLRGIYPPPRS